MIRSIGSALGFPALLAAIWGCSVASAADGSTRSSESALAASASPTPPSYPVDAPPPPHKPPQEAFDACKSHSEGDTCSVSHDGHTMSGTCRKGPNGETDLACVPAHPPGPPPDSNGTLSGTSLEHRLDRLEREIQGS